QRLVQGIDVTLQRLHALLGILHGAIGRNTRIRLRVGRVGSTDAQAVLRRRGCTGLARLRLAYLPRCRAATGGSRRTAGGVGRGATAIAVEGFKVLGVDAARFGRVNGANGRSVRDGQRFACAHQIHVVLDKRV